jgi:acetylornithine deacetylase
LPLKECDPISSNFLPARQFEPLKIEREGLPAQAMTTLSVHQKSIVDAVDSLRDEAIAFLQEIVRIPSVTGHEGEVQAVIAAKMRGLGLETDLWDPDPTQLAPYIDDVGAHESLEGRPNVVGTWKGTANGRSLILNAHIDTVESGELANWTHDPYAATIDGGRLYGRGACDMKAGLVTNVFAIAALRQAGLAPQGNVIVESVISEEDGGAGALATILRGYRADAAVITEPTKLAIVPAQGGSIVFRLIVPGRSAHACVRDEGVSAIELFSFFHQDLLTFEAERNAAIDHPLYDQIPNKIPINIGTVSGGNWPSSVPESLVAEGRAGLIPGESVEDFKKEFVDRVNHAARSNEWLRDHPPRVEWFSGQFAPAEIQLDHQLVRALGAAHTSVCGNQAAIEGVTYGADMRHFLNVGEIPCVMYGAGDVRVAHFSDEHVELADVLTATKTIALLIAEWCGTDSI